MCSKGACRRATGAVRMQLLGEAAAPLAPAHALPTAGAAASSTQRLGGKLPYLGASQALQFPGRMTLGAQMQTAAAVTSPEVSAAAAAAALRPSAVQVASQIVRTQGAAGLFNGVSATALRQVLYSSSRFGIYNVLKTSLEEQQAQQLLLRGDRVEGGPIALPAYKKVGAALFSGAVGAAIGNPADVALVRMQADGRLPVEARRNYTGVTNAIARISKEEGVLSLWRGCGPTVYRAMAVTAGQLAVYDQAKEVILERRLLADGVVAHVAAAFTAAIVASIASNPFDVVKTRMMSMKLDPTTGLAPYSSPLDCAVKTVKSEGPLALYKGLVPTITRQGPFALIMFLTLEQLRKVMVYL